MCSNYRPVTQADRLLTFFGVERDRNEPSTDVFPSGLAPMIVLAPDDGITPRRMMALQEAIFRLVPDFIAKVEWARRTYNARSETVASKRTFRGPWFKSQRCIIPAELIYEPRYDETGKSTRWAIQRAGAVPMGIAGIYDVVAHPDGRQMFTMAMLTVNADDHPFMSRFQAPGDEKRMVVILEEKDYAEWLACPVSEAPKFFRQWQGPLQGEAAPLPKRAKPSTLGSGPRVDPPTSGELF